MTTYERCIVTADNWLSAEAMPALKSLPIWR